MDDNGDISFTDSNALTVSGTILDPNEGFSGVSSGFTNVTLTTTSGNLILMGGVSH